MSDDVSQVAQATTVSRAVYWPRFPLCPDLRRPLNPKGGCLRPDDPPKRPDPGLYSQSERFAAGQSLTWDSPDITTNLSGSLDENVVVTVRNYSNEAAALGTQVQLDYSSFGIGFPRQSLGIQTVDLNKAGLNPDERSIEFFLPQSIRDKFGHLSVFVTVHHPHDRNANNNTGEQAWSASPANDGQAASFAFQLRNSLAQATTFDLVVLEATWSAALSDNQVILAAGQVRNLMLNVQVPVGASGQQHFNVVALVNGALFGGVHHRFDV